MMNDLISRAAVLRMLDENSVVFRGEIEKMPAVDAVPVIRCRGCEHFIDMSGTSYPSYCYKHSTFDADGEFDNAFRVAPDKYCAWGERRDDDGTD